ncbi:unnamed protein product, partial [Rotaria magnacalcarata]
MLAFPYVPFDEGAAQLDYRIPLLDG